MQYIASQIAAGTMPLTAKANLFIMALNCPSAIHFWATSLDTDIPMSSLTGALIRRELVTHTPRCLFTAHLNIVVGS